VLTRNGWLRLANQYGEVTSHPRNPNSNYINGNNNNVLTSNNLATNSAVECIPQPTKPSRLSSMAVPSSFIDKRICIPEKPISSAVESSVVAASQHLGPRTHRRSTELSRAALVALERSSGGRTTSDCTSSWDTSTGGDEYDDGKGGSSYGKKKRGSSQTSSRLHSDNRGVVRDSNRRRNSNEGSVISIQSIRFRNVNHWSRHQIQIFNL